MFEVKEKLTKENILSRIDEYSIFKAYCPNFKEIETGFIAYGADIKSTVIIPTMGLEDIAPIVAKLLGLSMNNLDGVLYPSVVK